MKAFGWAIIGSGAIANTVAKEITKTGRHRVISVFSRTHEKSVIFANKYNATAYETFDEAVSAEGVECVYLATPHSVHYGEIMRCIELGIPVLSEKAFTINSKQTESIINAKGRRSYVSEGMWTRYNPITIEVRRLVESGALGKIESIDASFCYPFALSNFSKRVVLKEYGGGALLDIGVYPISYVEMLLGMPDKIESTMTLGKYRSDKADTIALHYGDTICNLRCALDRLSTCSMTIRGSLGTIKIPLFYRPTRAKIVISGQKKVIKCKAGYIHEFDKVAEEVRSGCMESSTISLASTLNVMRIMDEIRSQHNLEYPYAIERVDFDS